MFHAIVDNTAQPEGFLYYNNHKNIAIREELGNGTKVRCFASVSAIPNMSFLDILETIVDLKLPTGSSLLICSHGTETSLYLPVYPENKRALDITALQLFNGWGELVYFGNKAQMASELQVSVDQLDYLQMLIGQVQALRIDHVAIRACQVGRDPQLMAELAKVFHCQNLSAPKMLDTYSEYLIPKVIAVDEFQKAVDEIGKGKAKTTNYFIYGNAPNRLIVQMRPKPHHRFGLSSVAESRAAIDSFIKTILPEVQNPGQFQAGQSVYFHALSPLTRNSFTFQSDPGYEANIVFKGYYDNRLAPPVQPKAPDAKRHFGGIRSRARAVIRRFGR